MNYSIVLEPPVFYQCIEFPSLLLLHNYRVIIEAYPYSGAPWGLASQHMDGRVLSLVVDGYKVGVVSRAC